MIDCVSPEERRELERERGAEEGAGSERRRRRSKAVKFGKVTRRDDKDEEVDPRAEEISFRSVQRPFPKKLGIPLEGAFLGDSRHPPFLPFPFHFISFHFIPLYPLPK